MKQTKECSVVKGIKFHTEKISPVHIRMQNVRLFVCLSVFLSVYVSVCQSGSKNGITFDLLHEIN